MNQLSVLPANWDWSFFWFAILAGVFFGVYVFYKGTEASSWREIVGWGAAVYLTFILLANVHRFVEGHDAAMDNFITGGARWWGFILSIVVTAGLLRKFHKFLAGGR